MIRATLRLVDRIDRNEVSTMMHSKVCTFEKSKGTLRNENLPEDTAATKGLERIYSELVGPTRYQPIGRSNYFVAVFNSFSGYSLVRLIHHKSEAGGAVFEILTKLENLFNSETKNLTLINRNFMERLRSDGGGELIGEAF